MTMGSKGYENKLDEGIMEIYSRKIAKYDPDQTDRGLHLRLYREAVDEYCRMQLMSAEGLRLMAEREKNDT